MTVPQPKTGCFAVALGDPAGVGPEVALKALASELPADTLRYLLIGNETLVHSLNDRLALKLPIRPFASAQPSDRVLVLDPQPSGSSSLSALSTAYASQAAQAAVAWLKEGAARCLRREVDALITAPVNKEAIIRSGQKDFVGQTELLSALADTERTAMMLLGCDDRGRWLRVALATTHLPIARVPQSLTREKIELAIE